MSPEGFRHGPLSDTRRLDWRARVRGQIRLDYLGLQDHQSSRELGVDWGVDTSRIGRSGIRPLSFDPTPKPPGQ
jgi:hypothetical protein